MNHVQTRESCRRRVDETRVNRREAADAGAGSRDTADGAVRKWTRETLGRRTGHPHPPVTCGTGGSTGPHTEPRPWGVGEGTETQAWRWTPHPAGTLLKSPRWGTPRAVELHLLSIHRRPSVSPASSPSALGCGIWAGAGGSSSHLHPGGAWIHSLQPTASGGRPKPPWRKPVLGARWRGEFASVLFL